MEVTKVWALIIIRTIEIHAWDEHEILILNLDFYLCISNLAIRISNFSNILCVWVSRKYRLWSTSLVEFEILGAKFVKLISILTLQWVVLISIKVHLSPMELYIIAQKNLWIANMYLLHTACKYCRRRAKNKMNDECISRLQFFIDAYYSFCDMNIECVRNTVS